MRRYKSSVFILEYLLSLTTTPLYATFISTVSLLILLSSILPWILAIASELLFSPYSLPFNPSFPVLPNKFREIVKDREAWHAAVHGVTESWTLTNSNNNSQYDRVGSVGPSVNMRWWLLSAHREKPSFWTQHWRSLLQNPASHTCLSTAVLPLEMFPPTLICINCNLCKGNATLHF